MRKILALSFFAFALICVKSAKADTLYQYDIQQIYVGQNTCSGRPCTQSLDVTLFANFVATPGNPFGPFRVDILASGFTVDTFGDLGSGVFGAPNVGMNEGVDNTVKYTHSGPNYIALFLFGQNEFDLGMSFLSPYVQTEDKVIGFSGEIWSCSTSDCVNDFGNGRAQAGYHYEPAFSLTTYKVISTPEPGTIFLLAAGLLALFLYRRKRSLAFIFGSGG